MSEAYFTSFSYQTHHPQLEFFSLFLFSVMAMITYITHLQPFYNYYFPCANDELTKLPLALTIIVTSANDAVTIPNRWSTFLIYIHIILQ
jgi:hypothetical protein